jgi:hypothetical protein
MMPGVMDGSMYIPPASMNYLYQNEPATFLVLQFLVDLMGSVFSILN